MSLVTANWLEQLELDVTGHHATFSALYVHGWQRVKYRICSNDFMIKPVKSVGHQGFTRCFYFVFGFSQRQQTQCLSPEQDNTLDWSKAENWLGHKLSELGQSWHDAERENQTHSPDAVKFALHSHVMTHLRSYQKHTPVVIIHPMLAELRNAR